MYETDAIDHRCLDSRFTDRGQRLIYESDRNLDQNGGGDPAERWKLLNVALSGGAPWGFTLRGGLEHGEPLIITKVEEGSKAAAVRLQAGDELVTINEVPLSGYRQEAICLVKGSHRTLTLEVKRKMKMVDFVAQKMPSESDVHVARNFLTKILRSSMRRNEPMSRPHSWHSTKFNENQSDTAKAQHTPLPVWQTRYDASSFSSDLTAGWHQTNLRRVSDQFSSLGSMDSLEHTSHPYSNANSTEHLGGGKRDSAYSSFSTSSGTPDYTLSKSNTASTENMLYKVNQWDSGSRSSNGRNSQNLADGVRLDERIGYLQLPSGSSGRESPRTEEQSGHRYPGSGRASIGPIWHIPDTKKTIAPSPPPPTPPTRSDSFAATKVHEKGLVPSYTEGTGNHAQSKLQGKGLEKATDVSESTLRIYHGSESSLDTCQTYNPPPKSETLNPYIATESYNHPTQNLNSNKTYSLSSTDIRAGLPSYTQMPYHRRQYSDESTFHAPSRTPIAPKPQNVGGCYSSMQELPTNYHAQHHGQNQIKRPTASVSNTANDQNPDSNSSSRYYCITSRQHPQGTPEASLVRVEDWKANSAMETTHSGVERSQGPPKDKNGAPQVSQHLTNNKDSNEYYRQVDGQHRANTSVSIPGHLLDDAATNVLDSRRNNKSNVATNADPHSISYPPVKQSEPGRMARPLRSRESSQEYLACKSESKSSPPKNPMLHSLSQESGRVGGGQGDVGSAREPTESIDPQVARQMRHNERFATTLRNEIQMRRAKLQKSRSTAALGGSSEAEEEPSVWKSAENSSSSFGSFTSTYKDHLKEAQARVLKATSFKRRDLEPVLLEHPGAEVMSGARRDTPSLPSVSEGPPSKPAVGGNQVTRICGRKRIPAEKKVRSFSEPEKMNEVGVNEELPPIDSSVSLAGRRKFFEAIGKPAYPKPVPKQTADDPGLAKPGGKPQSVESEGTWRDGNAKASSTESSKDGPDSLQRLGTFAEYEATWNIQRKPAEPRASGRYHSADNILDSGVEERSKPSCFHERSRSSPSDDFYGQNIPVQERKSAEFTSLHDCSSRISQGGSNSLVSKQKQEPTPSYLIGGDLERNLSDPLSTQYKSPASPAGPPLPDHSILAEPSSSTNHKSPISQRPPLPRLDKYRCPEAAPPVCTSEDGAAASHSPVRDASSAPVPPPVFWKEPKHSKGPKTEEEHRPEASPLRPSSPSGSPAHRTAGLTQPTGAQPTMEGHRSPSPQFAPQRLTDQPPVSVSLHDETPGRMDMVTDDNTTVKKVPIKIVRSESNAEKGSREYLHPSAEVLPSPLGAPGSPLSSLGSPEQASLFCTYTRQRDQGPEEQAPAVGPQKQQEPSGTVAGPQDTQDQLKGSCNGVTSGNLSTPSLSEEDEKRKVLTRDIIDKDKSLADILDQSKMRTTMDLMEGLFPQGEQLMEEADQRRRAAPKQASSRTSDNRREEAGPTEAAAAALVTSSAYYSTSAPKAELLIKMKDMQGQSVEVDSEEELGKDNDSDLASKKHELITSLSRKLQVLQEARESLRQDVHDNDALGEEVEATVQTICKPNELEKFRMFVGDLDKVVSLLLSLSGRLARVENALNSLEEDATLEERRTLTEKRKLLIRQHEDAKELKENLDRRERLVYTILDACLPSESLADYEHFVKMKSALIIEQRKLEDKIKLGEEQLKCLVDSLPIDQRAGV